MIGNPALDDRTPRTPPGHPCWRSPQPPASPPQEPAPAPATLGRTPRPAPAPPPHSRQALLARGPLPPPGTGEATSSWSGPRPCCAGTARVGACSSSSASSPAHAPSAATAAAVEPGHPARAGTPSSPLRAGPLGCRPIRGPDPELPDHHHVASRAQRHGAIPQPTQHERRPANRREKWPHVQQVVGLEEGGGRLGILVWLV